jgi:hypothetical protein
MDSPQFILPLATDVAAVQTQKLGIVNSTPNELVRAVLYNVLTSITDAINIALRNPNFTGNSIQISMDPTILARPQFSRVTTYLTARGFSSVINATSLTVSW